MSLGVQAAVEPSAPVWRCASLWIDRNFSGWSDSVTFFEQKTRDLPVFSVGTGLRSTTSSSVYTICFTSKQDLANVLRLLPQCRVPRAHWRVVPAGEADEVTLRKLRSFGYINTAEAAAEPAQLTATPHDFSFRVLEHESMIGRFLARLLKELKRLGVEFSSIDHTSGDVHRYARHPGLERRNLNEDDEEDIAGATDVDTVTITGIKFKSTKQVLDFCTWLTNTSSFYGILDPKKLAKSLLSPDPKHVYAAAEPRPEMDWDDFRMAIANMPSPLRGLNFRYLDGNTNFPVLRVWRTGQDEMVGSTFYYRFGSTDNGKITADLYRAGKKLHRICVLSEMRNVREIQKHIYLAVSTHFLSSAHAAAEPEAAGDLQQEATQALKKPLVIRIGTHVYTLRRTILGGSYRLRFTVYLRAATDDFHFASVVFEPDDNEVNIHFTNGTGGFATHDIRKIGSVSDLFKLVIRDCEHKARLLSKTIKEQLGLEDTVKKVGAAAEPKVLRNTPWTPARLGTALFQREDEVAEIQNGQAGGCSVTFSDIEDDNTFVLSVSYAGKVHKVGFYPGPSTRPKLELRDDDDNVLFTLSAPDLQKLVLKLPSDPVKALIVLVVAFVRMRNQKVQGAAEPAVPVDKLPGIELRLDDSWDFNHASVNNVIDDVENVLKKHKCTFKEITVGHRTWDEENDLTGHVVEIEGLMVPATAITLPKVLKDLFAISQMDIRSTVREAMHEIMEGMRQKLDDDDYVVIGHAKASAEPAVDNTEALWKTLLKLQDTSFKFEGWNITVADIARKQGNVVLQMQIDPSVSDLRFVIAPDYVQVSTVRGRDSISLARAAVVIGNGRSAKDIMKLLFTLKQHGKTLFQHYLEREGLQRAAEAAAEPSATVPMHLRVYTNVSAGMPVFSAVVTSVKQRLEKLLQQYGAQPGKFEIDDEYYTWIGVLHCPKTQLLALATKLHALGVHSDFDGDVEEIKNNLRAAIRYYPSLVCVGHGSLEDAQATAAAEPEAEPQPNKDGVIPYVHAVDGKIRGLLQLLTKWTAAERNTTGKESLRRLLVLCKEEAWPKLSEASKKKLLDLK